MGVEGEIIICSIGSSMNWSIVRFICREVGCAHIYDFVVIVDRCFCTYAVFIIGIVLCVQRSVVVRCSLWFYGAIDHCSGADIVFIADIVFSVLFAIVTVRFLSSMIRSTVRFVW